MIDHISLRVSDFQRSRAFYEAALAPLGYTLVFSNDKEQYAGFAGPDRERIWIGRNEGPRGGYIFRLRKAWVDSAARRTSNPNPWEE